MYGHGKAALSLDFDPVPCSDLEQGAKVKEVQPMSASEQFYETDELHPIDVVETLAAHHEWDFDRTTDDQISMSIEGQWRTYSITLAWSEYDETLRLICTFEMEPPEASLPALYECLNLCNDMCWTGQFSYWEPHKLMVYRYGLTLAGGAFASPDQINRMIEAAVTGSERFYPAFQLVCWAYRKPEDAMQVAIAEAYGRA